MKSNRTKAEETQHLARKYESILNRFPTMMLLVVFCMAIIIGALPEEYGNQASWVSILILTILCIRNVIIERRLDSLKKRAETIKHNRDDTKGN